jgi:hypothetical protein
MWAFFYVLGSLVCVFAFNEACTGYRALSKLTRWKRILLRLVVMVVWPLLAVLLLVVLVIVLLNLLWMNLTK